MKVGIITMHCVKNFGAVLQTYALQTILKDKGYNCVIIDYVPPIRSNISTIFPIKKEKRLLTQIVSAVKWFPVKVGWIFPFEMFVKEHLDLSKKKYRNNRLLEMDPPQCDAYITGSDQVWNPDCNDGIDQAFYLTFSPEGKKRISYAASIGRKELKEFEKNRIKALLEDFQAISVREFSALNILTEMGIPNVKHVLDPTLLVEKKQWGELATGSKVCIRKRYVLVFTLGSRKELNVYAKRVAEQLGCIVVKLGWDFVKPLDVDQIISFAKPQDFIKLFLGADYIITNSFHGTVFSIIFNKQFLSLPPTPDNQRFVSILTQFGIMERSLQNGFDMNVAMQKIDFSRINRKLEIERRNSISFLLEALTENIVNG